MTKNQPSLALSARQATPSHVENSNTRIDTSLLIPGRGPPIPHATLIFNPSTSLIIHIGATSTLPSQYASLPPTFIVPVLMPGLWDCHVHFFGEASPNLEDIAFLPPALAGFRAARDVVRLLDAGFTSVREVGG